MRVERRSFRVAPRKDSLRIPVWRLAERFVLSHSASVAFRKKSDRADRRARARAHEELVRDLERLARIEPGGSPARPILIDTPVLVDIRAVAKPCPLCAGFLRLEKHAAVEIDGDRLRVATVVCTSCGIHRSLYFQLGKTSLH